MTFADDSNVVNSLHHIPEGSGQNLKIVHSQPQIQLQQPTIVQQQTHTPNIQRLVLTPASTQHAHPQPWHQSARQLEPQRQLELQRQPSPQRQLHASPIQNLYPEDDDTLSIERQSINLEQPPPSQQHLNFRSIMDPYFHPNPTGPHGKIFLEQAIADFLSKNLGFEFAETRRIL